MAYSRYRRRANFRRRVRRGVRRYRRKFRRGARRYVRRSMTRRQVVNTAANKCHDNMPSANISSDGASTVVGIPTVMASANLSAVIFCASARGSQWTEAESEYARKKTEVYAKGYLDKVTIETVDGGNWRWRRIAFQCYSDDMIASVLPNTMAQYDSQHGYVRTVRPITTTGDSGLGATLRQLFQGTLGTDYYDLFVAVCDRNRNRILMDRTLPIQSPNGNGVFRNYRDYIGVNKKIRYNEKEIGYEKDPESDVIAQMQNYTWFATPTRYSGGDVYVVDLFSCADGGNVNSQLNFLSHGTYYWHEK